MRTKTIGLIAHTEKAGVAKLARDVISEFKERSLKVIVENETAKIAKQKASGSIARIAQRSDLIVVLGGDGTILNVVAMAGKNLKPIFGINVGSLGFLTTVNSSAYREVVDAIVSGRISYSKRALLSVELRTNRRVLSSVHALNVDGREPVRLPPRAQIAVRRAKTTLLLGFLPDVSFFSVLRHKLKWTGSNV